MSTSFHPALHDRLGSNNPYARSARDLADKLARAELWQRPEIALRHCQTVLDAEGYTATSTVIREDVLRCLPSGFE